MTTPRGSTLARLALRLAVALVLAFALLRLLEWGLYRAEMSGSGRLMISTLALVLAAYALLMAVPFVPGVEIGLALLAMRGAEIAPFVYLATLAGLSAAYLAGRYLSDRRLERAFADLHMSRAAALLARSRALTREQRLAILGSRLPARLRPLAIHGRYALLALLLNLPGNAVLGGGGGICLLAGLTRLFGTRAALATVAAAVLPVPLAVWLWGSLPFAR